jgi:hypothetical protein
MALGAGAFPTRHHGLTFKDGTDLLSSSAEICDRGTFWEYLKLNDYPPLDGTRISLAEALGFIVELKQDVDSIPDIVRRFSTVHVDVTSNSILLKFYGHVGDFSSTWQQAYPALAGLNLIGDRVLGVPLSVSPMSMEAAAPLIRQYLMPSLIYSEWDSSWYVFRHDQATPVLPRNAYYLIATHILGSIVRYQPELLTPITLPSADLGWFLSRFLGHAERFFPQLKMMELHGKEIYFSQN